MENLFSIHRARRVFTYGEAQQVLPVVIRITAESQREMTQLLNRLESIKYGSTAAAQELEEQIEQLIEHWQKKLSGLGVHPKGLWLADFDFGKGYYCWKYPESDLRFYHGYQDGFSGRKSIQPEGLS